MKIKILSPASQDLIDGYWKQGLQYCYYDGDS